MRIRHFLNVAGRIVLARSRRGRIARDIINDYLSREQALDENATNEEVEEKIAHLPEPIRKELLERDIDIRMNDEEYLDSINGGADKNKDADEQTETTKHVTIKVNYKPMIVLLLAAFGATMVVVIVFLYLYVTVETDLVGASEIIEDVLSNLPSNGNK